MTVGGILVISNMFYGFYVEIYNCTFIANSGQFASIAFIDGEVSTLAVLNVTQSTFFYNNASKVGGYIGIDYSQGGCICGLVQKNTYLYFFSSYFSQSYSRKGLILQIKTFINF